MSAIPPMGARVIGETAAAADVARYKVAQRGGGHGPRVGGPIAGARVVLPEVELPVEAAIPVGTDVSTVPVRKVIDLIRRSPRESVGLMLAQEHAREGGARKTVLEELDRLAGGLIGV